MMLNGQSLLKAPFKQRYEMIDREVCIAGGEEGRRFPLKSTSALRPDLLSPHPLNPFSAPCQIVNPRLAERELSERGKLKYKYDYNKEPFSVRKKGFYPLAESRKLVEKLIPQLTHESDGLIFQVR